MAGRGNRGNDLMRAATTSAHNAPALLALAEAAPMDEHCFGADVTQEALDRFRADGLPNRSDEQWRYTSLKELKSLSYRCPAVDDSFTFKPADEDRLAFGTGWSALLVFQNGRFIQNASSMECLPEGVCIRRIEGGARPIAHSGPTGFSDLNTLLATDAMELVIDPDTQVSTPIQFLFLNDASEGSIPTLHSTRVVVRMGANSSASILENHTGPDGAVYLSNSLTDCHLSEGASLSLHHLQRGSESAHHIARISATQMSNSHLSAFTVATGGKRSRLDLCARHEGTLATTVLNGLYIARGEQHMDHHIEVDHQQPHGRSGQTFRGILADASTGVFNGRVHVAVDAQQVDAQQSNRNLLLSRDAVVSAKPELEVYADDVKCAHGTTIGELDPRQIFYLRSRGLPEVEAKDLLTFAFASDLVQRIEIPAVAARLTDFMSSRFSRAQDVEELL